MQKRNAGKLPERKVTRRRPGTPAIHTVLSRLPTGAPRFVEPMKARLQEVLPRDAGWLFEVKLDGIRVIAVKNGDQVHLYSRLPRDITREYPAIAKAVAELPLRSVVLDGEIVAHDSHGRTSFQAWQNVKRDATSRASLLYYVFDLLQFDGRDVRGLPLTQRRASLDILIQKRRSPLCLSPMLAGSPDTVWKAVLKSGLEGIVAKRSGSLYESGRRSGAWVKVKRQNEQEFVIGGYTPPQGSRRYFGALLVGLSQKGKLTFVSRVGTGFDFSTLKSLHRCFRRYRQEACPFSNLPTRRSGSFGQGVTRAEMQRCTWLRPKLVCQVRFYEWTGDNSLRHPVFMGLREDKKPKDVVREKTE